MKEPENTFNWYSNIVYDHFNPETNHKIQFLLETGLAGNENGLNHTSTRFLVRNTNLAINKRNNIELYYSDIYKFYLSIQNLTTNGKYRSSVKVLNKNIYKYISVEINSRKNVDITITDESSITTNISVEVSMLELRIMQTIIKNTIDNWISISTNSNSVVASHRIISYLEKLNEDSNKNFNILQNITKTAKPVIVQDVPVVVNNAVVTEVSTQIDEPYNTNIKGSTENEYIPDENDVFDVDDDFTDNTIVNNTPIFTVTEDALDEITLEGEVKPLNLNNRAQSKIKKDIPRPFLNNFLQWDLKNLNNWSSGFLYTDADSNEMTLKPLELIITRSCGVEWYEVVEELCKNQGINVNDVNYHIISKLKKSILKYAETNKFILEPVFRLHNEKLDISENKCLYDFFIDLLTISIIICNFKVSIAKINYNKDNTNIYEILLSDVLILDLTQICINTFDVDTDKLKKDVIECISTIQKNNMLESMEHLYSSVSMGGKLNTQLNRFEIIFDKYIQLSANLREVTLAEINIGINSIDDIKSKLAEIVVKPKPEKSKQLKLLIRYCKENNIDVTITDKMLDLKDINITFYENENLHKIYRILRSNEDITKMIQLENFIEKQKNDELSASKKKSEEKELKQKVEEPVHESVWDVLEDDDLDFDNLAKM